MKNRPIKLTFLLLISIIALQSTWYALIAAQQVATPSILRKVDYVAIYAAGYIAHYQGLSHTYDLALQKRLEDEITYPEKLIRFYPYNHTPFLVHILQLVTTSNYTVSFYRWIVVLIAFHLLALVVLAHLMHFYGWQQEGILFASISGLLFYPIFVAYLQGQDSVFLLLGIALWTHGLLTDEDREAGLGLALAAIRPQIALMLAIPFLFKKRKIWWWLAVWGFVFLIYSYWLIGGEGLKNFIQALIYSGSGMGLDVNRMPNLMGAIIRASPAMSSQNLHAIGYGAYALAILFLCLLWAKSQRIEVKQVGLAILLSIIFSPHLQVHDLSLLLIPALGGALVLVEHKMLSQQDAALVPLAASLILLVNGIFWSYLVIYLLMLLLGLLLWFSGWKITSMKRLKT